jgi:hypothetical protein
MKQERGLDNCIENIRTPEKKGREWHEQKRGISGTVMQTFGLHESKEFVSSLSTAQEYPAPRGLHSLSCIKTHSLLPNARAG